MAKPRASLFPASTAEKPSPAPSAARTSAAPLAGPIEARKYPVAKTREGKRVATVYLEPEALKALQRVSIDEEISLQDLLVEGVNAVFQARGLSRIA